MTVTFLTEPAFEPLLRANGLTDFDALLRLRPAGPAVSRHWNRETVPVELRDGDATRRFFLKRLWRPQPEHVVGDLLRLRRPRTQPLHEWHNIGLLESLGVGCMKRVAAGQRSVAGIPRQAFLLGEALPATHTLADWFDDDLPGAAALPPWMRRRLLLELGALARKLDVAGLDWRGVDAKHIYAEPDEICGSGQRGGGGRGRRWRFWLLDVERIDRVQRVVGPRTAILIADALDPRPDFDGLRMPGPWDYRLLLGARMASGAAPAGRSRMESRSDDPDLLALARQRRLLGRINRRAWRPAARTGPQPDVPAGVAPQSDGAGNGRAHGADAATGEVIESISLDKPGLPSWRRRSRIRWRDAVGAVRTAYEKQYGRPPLGERFRATLTGHRRRSPAGIEWRAIRQLARIGVPVPGVIDFREWSASPHGATPARIVLAAAPGDSLERLLRDRRDSPPPPAARHQLIEQLAQIVRRMHANGFFHRDLYLAHVFADAIDTRPVLTLIDLARVIRRRRGRGRWRVKDLASLDYSSPPVIVTRADRLRFLRVYLGCTAARGSRQAGGCIALSPPARTRSGGRFAAVLAGVRNPELIRRTIAWIQRRTARLAAHDARHGRRGWLPPTADAAVQPRGPVASGASTSARGGRSTDGGVA